MLEWILSSCVLILIVLALRAILGGRISARLRYALWLVVLVRLLVPVQLFSLPVPEVRVPALPAAMEEESLYVLPLNRVPLEDADTIGAFVREDGQVDTSGSMGYARLEDDGETVVRYLERVSPLQVLQALWGLGIAAVLLVLLALNLRFAGRLRRVRRGAEVGKFPLPVYQADGLQSPCLFGFFRPAVYVPGEVLADETALRHVLAHEGTHYRHLDHIWSLLRCVALAVHWWNPLVWLAVVLSRRDGELACDEGALRRLGDGERAAYGETLLTLVTAKPRPADLLSCATTMTAGKRDLKARIQEIACKRKALVSATVAVILIALVAVGCAFGRGEASQEPEPPTEGATPAVQASDKEEWDYFLTLLGEENGHYMIYEVYSNDKELTFEQVQRSFFSSSLEELQSIPEFDLKETYIDGKPVSGMVLDNFLEGVQPKDLDEISSDGIPAEMLAEALKDSLGTAVSREDRGEICTLSFTAKDAEGIPHETSLTMGPREDAVTLRYRYEDGSEAVVDLTGGKLLQLMRRVRELSKEQPSQPDIQLTLWSVRAEDLAAENREELAILLHEAAWHPLSRLYDYVAYNTWMTEDWAVGSRTVSMADGSTLRLVAGSNPDYAGTDVYVVHESADRAPAAFFQSKELYDWVMAGEADTTDGLDMDAFLAGITAEKLTELQLGTYPNLTAETLAAALNGAAGKWKPYDETVWNEAMGLTPSFATEESRPPFWMVYTEDSLRSIQLVATSTMEDTVFASLRGERPSGADAKTQIIIEDEALYWAVRRANEREVKKFQYGKSLELEVSNVWVTGIADNTNDGSEILFEGDPYPIYICDPDAVLTVINADDDDGPRWGAQIKGDREIIELTDDTKPITLPYGDRSCCIYDLNTDTCILEISVHESTQP